MISATITTYTSGRKRPYRVVRLRITTPRLSGNGTATAVWTGPVEAILRGTGFRHLEAMNSIHRTVCKAKATTPNIQQIEAAIRGALALGDGQPYMVTDPSDEQAAR